MAFSGTCINDGDIPHVSYSIVLHTPRRAETLPADLLLDC